MLVFKKYSTRHCCQILMKLQFSQEIFEKCPYVKFHENPSNGNRVVPCERTDAFRNFALLKNPLSTIILNFQISNKYNFLHKYTYIFSKPVADRTESPSGLHTGRKPYTLQASSKNCGQSEIWISSQAVHCSCNLLI
jgi:hypothetical protein